MQREQGCTGCGGPCSQRKTRSTNFHDFRQDSGSTGIRRGVKSRRISYDLSSLIKPICKACKISSWIFVMPGPVITYLASSPTISLHSLFLSISPASKAGNLNGQQAQPPPAILKVAPDPSRHQLDTVKMHHQTACFHQAHQLPPQNTLHHTPSPSLLQHEAIPATCYACHMVLGAANPTSSL